MEAEKVSAMAAVFPSLPRDMLRQALASQGGNVDAAINQLLSEGNPNTGNVDIDSVRNRDFAPASNIVYDSGNPALDAARTRQVLEDEQLAQRLQREEVSSSENFVNRMPPVVQNLAAIAPSQAEIQDGISYLYQNLRFYSGEAYKQLYALYNKYVEGEGPNTPGRGSRNYQQEAAVVPPPTSGDTGLGPRGGRHADSDSYSSSVVNSRPGLTSRRRAVAGDDDENSKDK
mmetsp:Transcript_4808/g.14486  ORF Transcript_4808/g.14486 Transcript_4808/m.14486 type:complete len:230 (-) Transcript_4808:232-921(-)